VSEPITAENAHRAEQMALPLMWTAPHTHPELQGQRHQHFDDHGVPHANVPMVPFEPEGADYHQKAAALELVRSANRARHAALAAQGVQVQPLGIQLMRLQSQLDVLLKAVLTADERLDFELSFENQMANSLAEVEAAVPGMKLKAPMPPPPGANGTQLFMPPGHGRRN
jgi:hypothetical protein